MLCLVLWCVCLNGCLDKLECGEHIETLSILFVEKS